MNYLDIRLEKLQKKIQKLSNEVDEDGNIIDNTDYIQFLTHILQRLEALKAKIDNKE